MLDFLKPQFWFQKRTSAMDDARVRMEQMSQYNALFHLDPDKIVSAITQYNAGSLGQLAHIIRDLEKHDDKMATCSMKMKASVGRCDWSVQIKDGFADDERAKRHAEILKRFWSTVSVTDRFKMNERGGLRLLKKQMMEAQSFGFAVHEIVWKPLANGEISAEFIKLPLWNFENRTGALRFLPSQTASDGIPMAAGEWLVTTGDGVGIPAAICAMAKRMSFQDWLLFSERSGMPIIVGKTGATFGSDQWNNMKSLIRRIYRDTRALIDNGSSVEAIDTGNAANIPFPPLVEWADRAIAACYRGADLSTISKGDGTGASLQGDEAGMIEQDAAENLSEALHEQVDAFVIRYVTGDDEPLAKISIEPATKTDVDTDIKIDNHLVSMGCRLSKSDMMTRYGRTEATSDDDVAEMREQAQPGLGAPGFGGLANENQHRTAAVSAAGAGKPDAGDAAAEDDGSTAILAAFAKDMSPAGKAVAELLQDPSKEAAEALLAKLDTLLPEDPATAAVIAEEMAKAFGTVELANEGHPYTKCPSCGKFMSPAGNCEHCNFVEDDDRLIARGKLALERATTGNPKDVSDAMYRKGVGVIDFVQGWEGKGKAMAHGAGLLKIQQKHKAEMAQIPETIIKGTVTPLTVKGTNNIDKDGVAIINGTNIAILSRAKSDRWRLVTHYKSENDAKKITEAAKNATPA